MKKIYALILTMLGTALTLAQAPAYVWAKSIGGAENEYANSITTDGQGNIYMIGHFNSTVVTIGNTTFTNAGGEDILISKHDAAGSLIWAKQIGSTGDDFGYGISVDSNNDIFITGSFNSPTITFGATTFTNAGEQDLFLAKLSSSGNHVWAIASGGVNIDRSNSIVTDQSGNVFIAGYFASPCVFGTTTLTPVTNYDAFVVKYSSVGSCLWAKAATGAVYTGFNSLCTDANGNLIVVGDFESSTVDFGGTSLNNVSGYSDAFVAKYSPSGSVLWAQHIHGPEDDFGLSVATDASSNVIVGGRFFSSTLTIGGAELVRTGQENAFVAKFNSNGNPLWANSIAGTTYEKGTTVACDAAGNIIFGGIMSSPTLAIAASSYTNSGVFDSFIISYSPAGAVQWSKQLGGIDMDHIASICCDANSNILLAGYSTSNSLTFGPNTLTNTTGSTFDIFFAKIESAVSVNESARDISIYISPNPFSDHCSIKFDSFRNNSVVQIFDVSGREVKNISFTGTSCVISRDNIGSGVYFLRVTDEYNQSLTRKIVIQ